MDYEPGVFVAYADDVAKAFKCSTFIARNIMYQTGHCMKVGKKLAIPYKIFLALKNGVQVETPEDYMKL